MRFDGKVALVTGASQGIGKAVALRLADGGADVVMFDIDYEKLLLLSEKISAMGRVAMPFRCDISDEAGVNAAVAEALSKFGKIDILVNNAALWRDSAAFTEMPMDTWRRYMDVNVMGTVYVTHAVLPSMLERGCGRVINVASVAGVYGLANMAQYSATKGAIIAFSKALAREVVDRGVLVNAVSPGSVSPDVGDDLYYTQPSSLSRMGRTGSLRENANLICFLASDEASYINAENIIIDGGRKTL